MKVFLLDNYDSFTYNIVQLLESLGETPFVLRNTDASISLLEKFSPDRIIISPGPMSPDDHVFIYSLLERFHREVPVLGVCLGMQAVNKYFGGEVVKAPLPVHGKTSKIFHSHEGIFKGIPSPFVSARYHSLIASKIPSCLRATAFTADEVPMALAHGDYPVFGVQFHPESYLSKYGKKLMKNFLEIS